MNSGPDFADGRFDYTQWALGGFRFDDLDTDEPENDAVDVPHRSVASDEANAPYRAVVTDYDSYGSGLFGGPGGDLFGGRDSEVEARAMPRYLEAHQEPEPTSEPGSLVRPYTRTGGRTRPDYDLAIEALVSTSERGRERDSVVLPEHRSICGLCMETRSVAEIAAHLRLPLGVVRVLIGDMAGLGLVMIHQSGLVMGDRPSLAFLERVLSGLRRL